MNLRQAVVFSILMQNNNGIIDKSPGYIEEKVSVCKQLSVPEILLDSENLSIFEKYTEKWQKNWNKAYDSRLPTNSYVIDKITGEFKNKGE